MYASMVALWIRRRPQLPGRDISLDERCGRGFCGLPGSGKSTAINAIKDLGTVITMGDVIRKEAQERNIELSDENLGKIAKQLREEEGDEIIAEKSVRYVKMQNTDVIFIDGIRSIPEVKVFRKYWKFPLIAIISSDDLRFKRISERSRSDDSKTLSQIKERDKREIGFGLKEVILEANYKLENNSTIASLEQKTRELILDIIRKY